MTVDKIKHMGRKFGFVINCQGQIIFLGVFSGPFPSYYIYIYIYLYLYLFREYQPKVYTLNNSPLSSDQDTDQLLIYLGKD